MGGIKGFVEGGIASTIAASSMTPFDVIRTMPARYTEAAMRANPLLKQPRFFNTGISIVRHYGILSLFSGTSNILRRQTLYLTMRMGLHDILKSKWTDPETNVTTFENKISAGMMAGGMGAILGNPAEMAGERLQTDPYLPAAHRRNYKSMSDVITKVVKNEGLYTLWRGSSLAVVRAMLITSSQLATYDQIKETILQKNILKDGIVTHIVSSFAAGCVTTVVSQPVSCVMGRMAFEKRLELEFGMVPHVRYDGAMDCAMKIIRAEGPFALFKGMMCTFQRQGTFSVVLFVTLEQVRKVFKDL